MIRVLAKAWEYFDLARWGIADVFYRATGLIPAVARRRAENRLDEQWERQLANIMAELAAERIGDGDAS